MRRQKVASQDCVQCDLEDAEIDAQNLDDSKALPQQLSIAKGVRKMMGYSCKLERDPGIIKRKR